MNRRFKRGLVVGKFAPLHHGHELLIRHAAAASDELFIISYSRPELPGCEPERRKQWLAELFPNVQCLVVTDALLRERLPGVETPRNDDPDERAHRRFVGLLCLEILKTTVDAVFTSETYGEPFAGELTHFFRERERNHPAVQHVLVDHDRRIVPVSGTAIRADVHGQRRFLSPAVYASFVERVCFLGGESSGKSTLAVALARHFETAQVAEYGRELWEHRSGRFVFSDMLEIARCQVGSENKAARQATRFVFCDTTPLTTLFYSREMFGRAEPELEALAQRPYTLAILCEPDFPFAQDGTRRDAGFRARQHAWYLEQLERGAQPWIRAAGSVEERVCEVESALFTLEKIHGIS